MTAAQEPTSTAVVPPIDPELAPVPATLRQVLKPISADTLGEVRRINAEGIPGMPLPDLTAGGDVIREDRVVPGPEGEPDIGLLILRPARGAGPWPAIFHIHGGGMVVGTSESGIDSFVPYVAQGKAVVVSVEYRLAPEHPDPAPVEDCYAGLVWTADHAAELGIDANRIIVAGASAGGGLSAGTALMARDRGYPALSHQVLICPMLDDRGITPSSQVPNSVGIWNNAEDRFAWASLLGDRVGTDDVSYYAAPARCENLTGLPRTYIDCGSSEIFRDEILEYAAHLSRAGVAVDLHMWGGAFHGFDLIAPHAAISQASVATRNEFIERALA